MNEVAIYAYIPENGDGKFVPFYIGRTVDLHRRRAEHFGPSAHNGDVKAYVTAVTEQWEFSGRKGPKVGIYLLEWTSLSDGAFAERWWLKYARAVGWELFNRQWWQQ